jgi:hypothetical protein
VGPADRDRDTDDRSNDYRDTDDQAITERT